MLGKIFSLRPVLGLLLIFRLKEGTGLYFSQYLAQQIKHSKKLNMRRLRKAACGHNFCNEQTWRFIFMYIDIFILDQNLFCYFSIFEFCHNQQIYSEGSLVHSILPKGSLFMGAKITMNQQVYI